MMFEQMEYDFDAKGRITAERVTGEEFLPADDVDPRDRPGECVPVDRERPRHRVRQVARAGRRRKDVPVDAPRRVLRRRRRVRSEEHHLGGRARSPGRDLDPQFLHGPAGHEPAAADAEPVDAQDGPARVVVQERLQPRRTPARAAREPQGTLQEAQHRGRARVRCRAGGGRSPALPQLRRADGVRDEALHRVRRLHRHLPDRLPDHHARTARKRSLSHAAQGAAPAIRTSRSTSPRR